MCWCHPAVYCRALCKGDLGNLAKSETIRELRKYQGVKKVVKMCKLGKISRWFGSFTVVVLNSSQKLKFFCRFLSVGHVVW